MDRVRFVSGLRRRGFNVLGSGLYSTVLCKGNSDRVIKVGSTDNWLDYIIWAAREGYAGGLAPRVYSFKRFDHWYVAVMERLDCTVGQLAWCDEHKHRDKGGTLRAQCNALSTAMYQGLRQIDDAEKLLPGSGRFLTGFKAFVRGSHVDAHTGNWMLRGKELVCTDPITELGENSPRDTSRRMRSRDLTSLPMAA